MKAGWMPLRAAAEHLGLSHAALRKLCERHQLLLKEGVIESRFDGLVARKIGGRWRILLSDGWAGAAW